MKALLLAAASLIAASSPSLAGANLITFAQTSGSNEVFATANAADTVTTLTVSGASITIGELITGTPPAPAFLQLDATSIDAATAIASAVIQHYSA